MLLSCMELALLQCQWAELKLSSCTSEGINQVPSDEIESLFIQLPPPGNPKLSPFETCKLLQDATGQS